MVDDTLHVRVAEKFGWTVEQAQSVPLASLRDLVRPFSVKLVYELTLRIRIDDILWHDRVWPKRSKQRK